MLSAPFRVRPTSTSSAARPSLLEATRPLRMALRTQPFRAWVALKSWRTVPRLLSIRLRDLQALLAAAVEVQVAQAAQVHRAPLEVLVVLVVAVRLATDVFLTFR